MPISVTPRGALALVLILLPCSLTYINLFGWIVLILFAVKHVFGEKFAQILYAWHNTATDFCIHMFHILCALVLELLLGTRIAYTVVADAGSPSIESRYFNDKLQLDMSRILAPPSAPGKAKIIICNHFCRLDWLYLMCYCARASGLSSSLRVVLKESLRRLPVVGWFMESNRYIFLTRSWEKDASYVGEIVDFEMRTSAVHTFLIFPEGTDLSPSNIARSQEHALVTGLPVFNHVLSPRTTGLVALKNLIGSDRIESILDLTIAYTQYTPGERPEEMSLINGRSLRKVHLLVREWPVRPVLNQVTQADTVTLNELNENMMAIMNNSDATIVPSDDVGLAAWVLARFTEKEQLLGQFYLDDTAGFDQAMVLKVLGPAVTTATYDEDMEVLLHPERRKLQRCIEQIGERNTLYALVFWVVCSTCGFFWYSQLWVYLVVSTVLLLSIIRLSKRPGGIQRAVFLTPVADRAALWPRIVARMFATRHRSNHGHKRKHVKQTVRISPAIYK